MRRFLVPLVVVLLARAPAPAQEEIVLDPAVTVGPDPLVWAAPAVPPSRLWVRAEYLLWWVKNDETPGPLLTTGPAGVPGSGALGQPGTQVLFGDQLDYRGNSGGRLSVGWWFDDAQTVGLELNGFGLETHTIHGESNSNRTDGSPVIARPFYNTLTGQEDAQIITSPQDALGGRYLGGIDIFGDSRTWGGEVNLWHNLDPQPARRWDVLAGFRYLGQKDQLRFSQSSTVITPGEVGYGGAPAPAPDIVSLRDYFETTNHFYGGQVGVQGRWERGAWGLDLAGKIGLGATQQNAEIGGRTLLTDSAGTTLRQDGGLYVTPEMVGHHDRAVFSWMSEFNLRLGYRVCRCCQLQAGYTFLYWDGVTRPGALVDRAVDPRRVPSDLAFDPNAPGRPFEFNSTDFWAHGLTLGVEFTY